MGGLGGMQSGTGTISYTQTPDEGMVSMVNQGQVELTPQVFPVRDVYQLALTAHTYPPPYNSMVTTGIFPSDVAGRKVMSPYKVYVSGSFELQPRMSGELDTRYNQPDPVTQYPRAWADQLTRFILPCNPVDGTRSSSVDVTLNVEAFCYPTPYSSVGQNLDPALDQDALWLLVYYCAMMIVYEFADTTDISIRQMWAAKYAQRKKARYQRMIEGADPSLSTVFTIIEENFGPPALPTQEATVN
jgi:hypothetical protein